MTLKTVSRGVILALGVLSLALAPTASADADDYFLGELYKTHQKWYGPYGEGYIVAVAHGVCDDWAVNVGYSDEVESHVSSKRWTHRNSRFFIALATGTFCPEDTSRIPPDARLQQSGA